MTVTGGTSVSGLGASYCSQTGGCRHPRPVASATRGMGVLIPATGAGEDLRQFCTFPKPVVQG